EARPTRRRPRKKRPPDRARPPKNPPLAKNRKRPRQKHRHQPYRLNRKRNRLYDDYDGNDEVGVRGMPARKRSRAHLLSQLRGASGPFRRVGAEKSAGSARSAPALQKMLGPPNMARRNFSTVSKLALAAAVVAALVEIAVAPELPAPTKAVPPQVDLD